MKEESKSAMKREVEARQNIAVTMTTLSDKQLSQLHLPEILTKAIAEYKKMKSHGARRRQAQFLGRIMRELDSEQVEKMATQLLQWKK